MKKKSVLWFLVLCVLSVTFMVGCASSAMVPTTKLDKAEADFALVNFIRPSYFGGAIKFGLWDRGTVIGILTAGQCIQFQAAPGDHLFMARAENWGAVKATVAAGKVYTIIAEPRMGLMKAGVHLEVVKPGDARLKGWMESLTVVSMDSAERKAYSEGKTDQVLAAAANLDADKASYEIMRPEDGE
jgi:hypothetical protein